MKLLSHEQKMQEAWRFIQEVGITEEKEKKQEDDTLYLVENIYQVRDAYYNDLEQKIEIEDEDICGFFDRHGIKWE